MLRTNTCYVQEKEINHSNEIVYSLCYDVMKNTHHLYTIEIMRIGSREVRLDAGRFEKFSRDPQEFKVSISFEKGRDDMLRRTNDMVTWINTQGAVWSFDVEPVHTSKTVIDFTFDNLSTAVTFKLVWF